MKTYGILRTIWISGNEMVRSNSIGYNKITYTVETHYIMLKYSGEERKDTFE